MTDIDAPRRRRQAIGFTTAHLALAGVAIAMSALLPRNAMLIPGIAAAVAHVIAALDALSTARPSTSLDETWTRAASLARRQPAVEMVSIVSITLSPLLLIAIRGDVTVPAKILFIVIMTSVPIRFAYLSWASAPIAEIAAPDRTVIPGWVVTGMRKGAIGPIRLLRLALLITVLVAVGLPLIPVGSGIISGTAGLVALTAIPVTVFLAVRALTRALRSMGMIAEQGRIDPTAVDAMHRAIAAALPTVIGTFTALAVAPLFDHVAYVVMASVHTIGTAVMFSTLHLWTAQRIALGDVRAFGRPPRSARVTQG